MDKRFMVILGGIVVLFGAFFIISQKSSDDKGSQNNNQSSSSQASNHVMGEASSKVTLVEYGDFQCPVCGLYYQPTKDTVEGLKDKIKFQFRNLPIVQIHPNAFAAARAAEAADLQGKYWQMHDKLYENQTKWSGSTAPLEFFKVYAKDLGLNVTQFEKDYSSAKVNDVINTDLDEFAKTNQQQATPTYFLNDKVIDNKDLAGSNGFPSVEKFTAIINAELAKN
jgi:protein-disulfide isomerase